MCDELLEFIILPTSAGSTGEENYITPTTSCEKNVEVETFKWNRNNTLLFLDLYKSYRAKVGSLKIKNLKKMYEIIASELQTKTNTVITPANCENRWKHLERMHKKYVDNNNKTGRGRKDYEYANEMQDILGGKRSINPVLVLSSETVNAEGLSEKENTITTGVSKDNEIEEESANQNKNILRQSQYKARAVKTNLLKEIRNDRREYYRKRLEIENEKLREKLKKNKLLEERNNILRLCLQQNISLTAIGDLENLS